MYLCINKTPQKAEQTTLSANDSVYRGTLPAGVLQPHSADILQTLPTALAGSRNDSLILKAICTRAICEETLISPTAFRYGGS